MRKLLFGTAVGAVVLTVALIGAWAFSHSDMAEAQTVSTVAIDMNTAGNDDDTYGPINACVQIPNAQGVAVLTFDVGTPALPLTVRDGNYAGAQYVMMFNAAFTVSAADHTTAGTVLQHRNPDGWNFMDMSQAMTAPPWVSPVAISFTDLHACGMEGNGEGPGEPLPCVDSGAPNAAGGVFGRYTLDYDGTLGPGIYGITMTGVGYGGPAGPIYDDPTSVGDDDNDGSPDEDILLDSTAAHGLIAVGVPCPEEADLEKLDLQIKPLYGLKEPVGLFTKYPDMADDDGDTQIDEDPKDGIDNDGDCAPFFTPDTPCDMCVGGLDDPGCDEDPFGFLGIDNDGDTKVDEDGAGRIDFNGDTEITPYPDCVMVYYHGGLELCMYEDQLQGRDDDGDGLIDEDPLDADVSVQTHYILKELLINNGPAAMVPTWDIKEIDAPDTNEAGDPWGTEVSAHITDPTELIIVEAGVPLYLKAGMCSEPKVFVTDAGFEGTITDAPLNGVPGDCVAVDSVPGVVKELTVKKLVDLPKDVIVTVEQQFDLHCEGPSLHKFLIQNEIVADDPYTVDPGPGINKLEMEIAVACIAQTDVKELAFYPIVWPEADLLPVGAVVIGEDATIVMEKTLHNEGAWGPVDLMVYPTDAVYGYVATDPYGPLAGDMCDYDEDGNPNVGAGTCCDFIENDDPADGIDYNDPECAAEMHPHSGPFCTLTLTSDPAVPVSDVAVSANIPPIDHTYTLSCGRGGIGLDDDGDTIPDEDSPGGMSLGQAQDGLDQDADGQTDEDSCGENTGGLGSPGDYTTPGTDDDGDTLVDEDDFYGDDDCDTLIDEDGSFYLVQLYFDNHIEITSEHVMDFNPENNFSEFTPLDGAVLAVIRPFTPEFEHVCTTVDADVQSSPAEKVCEILTGCKQEYSIDVPGSGPMPFNGGQPLYQWMGIKPDSPSEMWWNSGVPATTAFLEMLGFPPGWDTTPGLDNATKVGQIKASITVDPDGAWGTAFDLVYQPVLPPLPLYDTCLPPATTGGDMVHTILGGRSLVEPDCFVDLPATGDPWINGYLAMMPGSAADPGTAYISWSSHLDHSVNQVLNAQPTAFLWARYSSAATIGEDTLPITILVFDMSGGNGVGPWGTVLVLSDPTKPDVPGESIFGTPFGGDILILGTTEFDDPVDPGVNVKVCMASTDPLLPEDPAGHPGGPHVATGMFTRADIGDSVPKFDYFNCTAMTNVYCGLTKNETPEVGVNLLEQETVEVTITNENIATDVIVQLSLLSDPECAGEWVAAYGATPDPPIMIGLKQLSKMTFLASAVPPGGAMGAPETRIATVDYEVYCDAGSHPVDITVNLTPTPMSDADVLDNQCQNHVIVTATNEDVDGDGVVNWEDNCPGPGAENKNPGQEDNDGDGVPGSQPPPDATWGGDVCDADDDNDGFPDGDDLCPFAAEDPDELDTDPSYDGCPESDVTLVVVKQGVTEPIEVNVSEDTPFTVTATATNGDYGPTDLRFIELLKSDPNGCVARWVCQPELGDQCIEEVIDTDGDTVPELVSQLEVVAYGVPPYNSVVKVREYTVHCPDKCLHEDAIFLEEAVVPEYPVLDPDVSNQVDKAYIDVIAWTEADVKLVAYEVHSAAESLTVNIPAVVVLKKVLHNNGPQQVTVDLAHNPLAEIAPENCSVWPIDVPPVVPEMPTSVQTSVFEEWGIVCSEPSFHTFTWENEATFYAEHVRDADPSNNSATVSLTIPFIAHVDISVDQVVTDAPTSLLIGDSGMVTLEKTLTYTGDLPEIEVAVVKSVTLPPPKPDGQQDCYVWPYGDQFQVVLVKDQPMVIVEEFEIGCGIDPAATFTFTNTVSVKDADPHIVGTLEDSDSDEVTVQFGVDAVAVMVGVEDPETGDCPAEVISKVQSHEQKVNFCEEEINVWGFEMAAVNMEVETGELPACEDLVHPNPEKQIEDCILKIKKIYFSEPARWHCQGDRCTINSNPVPPSTKVWEFLLDLDQNQVPETDVCVVERPDSAPYVESPCWKDITKYGLKIVWKHWDKELQRWVKNEVWQIQEKTPRDQWDEEVMQYLPDFVLDELGDAGFPTSFSEFDLTPASPGPRQLEMRLVVTLPDGIDLDLANNEVSGSAMVNVAADSDADSVRDDLDNCPDDFNPGQADTDGDGIGDACDDTPYHDVGIKYCLKFGPAPVNIGDSQGKFMWTICEIGNFSLHTETVQIALSVTGAPAGCSMDQALILPGQDTFLLEFVPIDDDGDGPADEDPIDGFDNDGDTLVDEDPPQGEQKFVLWRNMFLCETAAAGTYPLVVEACVDHLDHDPPAGDDTFTDNNCHLQTRNMIVHDPGQ